MLRCTCNLLQCTIEHPRAPVKGPAVAPRPRPSGLVSPSPVSTSPRPIDAAKGEPARRSEAQRIGNLFAPQAHLENAMNAMRQCDGGALVGVAASLGNVWGSPDMGLILSLIFAVGQCAARRSLDLVLQVPRIDREGQRSSQRPLLPGRDTAPIVRIIHGFVIWACAAHGSETDESKEGMGWNAARARVQAVHPDRDA
jgi:hypothetical protein